MSDRLAITGIGMVSSLGLSCQVACAAARAGITRTVELDSFTNWSPVDGAVTPVTAHQIPELTDGFEQDARLMRILSGALADLCKTSSSPDLADPQLGVFLVLPDRYRIWRGSQRMVDEAAQTEVAAVEAETPDETLSFGNSNQMLRQACNAVNIEPGRVLATHVGRCGLALALLDAQRHLEANRIQAAVICCVDSWLDATSLTWLHRVGKLKSPTIPTGMAPGEAGVAIRLTSEHLAGEATTTIDNICIELEENSFFSGKPALGRVCANQMQKLANKDGNWSLTDLNGEEFRAMEWGQALVRSKMKDIYTSHPAVSYGDTGVAALGLSVAMADHLFRRSSAPWPQALVFGAGDSGQRSAFSIISRL